jgi:ArsR family transcriptional regulator
MPIAPLDRTFKALGDPTRLRIVNLLLDSAGCVCELEPALGLPQPLLSRHLAYLRYAGLVRAERDGMRVNYSLALDGELGPELRRLIRKACTGGVFLKDLAKWRQKARRARP